MRISIVAFTILAAAGPTVAAAQTAPIAVTENVATGQTDAMASNLVGLDVHNAANDDIGEIEDLVLDSSRKVTGLVLSVGGIAGMGSKYVVLAPAMVAVSYDSSAKKWKAVTTATEEQIKATPEFKYEGKFDD